MQASDAQQMASAQPASSYSIQVFRYLCKNYFRIGVYALAGTRRSANCFVFAAVL